MLIHLALDGKSAEVRRNVNTVVAGATIRNPVLTNQLMREALAAFLAGGLRGQHSASADGISVIWNKHARLSGLLLSAVSFAGEAEVAIREESVVQLIVVVHHQLICSCLTTQEMHDMLINR